MTQYFQVETTHQQIKILRMGAAAHPATVLGADLLLELDDILTRLADSAEVRGLVIIGANKDFALGANINDISFLKDIDATRAAATKLQRLFTKLEKLPFPTVAAIDGQCLGGGLELSLACQWRIVTDRALLALPEIQLGLIPGAGGTQRLPRLIGIQAALDLILTGKRIPGKKAVKIGLADACTHPSQLELIALSYTARHRDKKTTLIHAKTLGTDLPRWAAEHTPIGRAFVEKKARELVIKDTKNFYPAALKALDAVFDGFDKKLEKGLEIEAGIFSELAHTQESKSLVHLFHATTAAKRNAYAEAGRLKFGDSQSGLVGVIGSGFMGAGIATVLADKGIRVLLSDPNKASTKRAMAGAYKFFAKKALRRQIKNFELWQRLAHISPGLSVSGFAKADLVIEAVYEDIGLKQEILAQIEEKAHPSLVFASNTSALPISEIAAKAKFPERILGMHFFSPVEKMPLLEIVITEKTAAWAIDRAFRIGLRMGKQIIVVKDSPGFYTTRALAFFLAEASLILEEGAKIEEIEEALLEFGFPVGPITLMDEVGIDVSIHVLKSMSAAFGTRLKSPAGLDGIQQSGRLGRKNGKGFFHYENGEKGKPDDSIYELMGETRSYKFISIENIVDRCVLVFINETIRCLGEGILLSAFDGDIGAVFGLGFPPFLGGPLHYTDHLGAQHVYDKLRELEAKFGSRFAPAPLLAQHAKEGTCFFPKLK